LRDGALVKANDLMEIGETGLVKGKG